jgi:ERCC4-related helicase
MWTTRCSSPLLVGRKVKVLLGDLDLARWRQDLTEDRNRLATLHAAALQVDAGRDDKLKLRELIADKVRNPINAGNRKLIVFTAFADTAGYLYEHLAGWARDQLGIDGALVTGSGGNQTTMPGLRQTWQHPHRLLAPVQGAPGRAGRRR